MRVLSLTSVGVILAAAGFVTVAVELPLLMLLSLSLKLFTWLLAVLGAEEWLLYLVMFKVKLREFLNSLPQL